MLILSWAYSGQSKIIIPNSAFSYQSYINSMPYTLTINPSCGNGIKTPDEQGDDGNSVSGDGGSNSGKIEANCTGTGGSLTSKNTGIGNKPSEETHTSVSDEEIDNKILSYVFYGFILLAAIFNFITSMLSSGSVQSIFHYINQVQLVLIIPLLPSSMSKSVIDFISRLSYGLLNFGDLFNQNSLEDESLINLSYPQSDPYLNKIKLKSESGLFNIKGTIIVTIGIVLLHLLIFIVFLGIRNRYAQKWYVKALK